MEWNIHQRCSSRDLQQAQNEELYSFDFQVHTCKQILTGFHHNARKPLQENYPLTDLALELRFCF